MKPIEPVAAPSPLTGTVSEELDRLDVLAGKIGMNSAEQAFSLLHGLDAMEDQIKTLEPGSQSRFQVETQFGGIVAVLHSEAGRFIRDLGGIQALVNEREKTNPPEDHSWWYLDRLILERSRSSLRRAMIISAIVLGVFAVVVIVYKTFLAPDPIVVEVYGREQNAKEAIANKEMATALSEVNQGLQVSPRDPVLLIMKGVLLENAGEKNQAAQLFDQAKQVIPSQEDFYLERGQDYSLLNEPDKALADVQAALNLNPNSATAYLLAGQIHETLQKYQEAIDDYNKAFDAAEKSKKTELAALARTRLAMLLQVMHTQLTLPAEEQTQTPTP